MNLINFDHQFHLIDHEIPNISITTKYYKDSKGIPPGLGQGEYPYYLSIQ